MCLSLQARLDPARMALALGIGAVPLATGAGTVSLFVTIIMVRGENIIIFIMEFQGLRLIRIN